MRRRKHPYMWLGSMTMAVGILLWVKLKLVSDFPRTAYADDGQQQVDEPQVQTTDEPEMHKAVP